MTTRPSEPDHARQPDAEQAVLPGLGVVIVSYMSGDVIEECLSSLKASDYADLRIFVVDNASPDDSVAIITDWAARTGTDFAAFGPDDPQEAIAARGARLSLIRSQVNGGFAHGVNLGLKAMLAQQSIDLFWILNPDCIVTPSAATAYRKAAATAPDFALMGGRLVFPDPPYVIQSDGGRINRWTGICSNVNQGLPADQATAPGPDSIDYVAGANFVASRRFVETAGLLEEAYFLYFEEIEWAFRQSDLPLRFCQDALVMHHNGTAIGSGSMNQRASAFSNYFNFRNRLRFVRTHFPAAVPTTYLYSMAKIVKMALSGARDEAGAAFLGLNQLPPPAAIRARLSPDAAEFAFAKPARAG